MLPLKLSYAVYIKEKSSSTCYEAHLKCFDTKAHSMRNQRQAGQEMQRGSAVKEELHWREQLVGNDTAESHWVGTNDKQIKGKVQKEWHGAVTGDGQAGCKEKVVGMGQASQDSGHGSQLLQLRKRLDNVFSHMVWFLGGPVWSRELDSLILMDSFSLAVFYDSTVLFGTRVG